jgi:hypothetical protein
MAMILFQISHSDIHNSDSELALAKINASQILDRCRSGCTVLAERPRKLRKHSNNIPLEWLDEPLSGESRVRRAQRTLVRRG